MNLMVKRKNQQEKEMISLQLTKEFKQKLEKAASRRHTGISGLIRWVLSEYLEKEAKQG